MTYDEQTKMDMDPADLDHDRPTEAAEADDTAAISQTWDEYERKMKDILSSLGDEEFRRELDRQREIFRRHSTKKPVNEERNRLFLDAFESVSPDQRSSFLELAKKSL